MEEFFQQVRFSGPRKTTQAKPPKTLVMYLQSFSHNFSHCTHLFLYKTQKFAVHRKATRRLDAERFLSVVVLERFSQLFFIVFPQGKPFIYN